MRCEKSKQARELGEPTDRVLHLIPYQSTLYRAFQRACMLMKTGGGPEGGDIGEGHTLVII